MSYRFWDTRVPLDKVFAEGFVPPCDYQVVGKKGQPQGTVRVGLKFIPKVITNENFLLRSWYVSSLMIMAWGIVDSSNWLGFFGWWMQHNDDDDHNWDYENKHLNHTPKYS